MINGQCRTSREGQIPQLKKLKYMSDYVNQVWKTRVKQIRNLFSISVLSSKSGTYIWREISNTGGNCTQSGAWNNPVEVFLVSNDNREKLYFRKVSHLVGKLLVARKRYLINGIGVASWLFWEFFHMRGKILFSREGSMQDVHKMRCQQKVTCVTKC